MSTMKKLYKSHLPTCIYLFANGKPAYFIQGKYATDIETEVTALDAEVAYGHPHIYIDAAETEIDTKYVDPMEALREKIIADYKAQEAAAINPARDMGSTESVVAGKLKGIASSANVNMMASGSTSGATSAAG